jgi:hypothetical protein
MIRLWAGWSKFWILAGKSDSIFFKNHSGGLWGPSTLLFNGYQVSVLEIKWPGREFEYLPPSSVEVTNDGSCTNTPAFHHFASAVQFLNTATAPSYSVACFNLCEYNMFALLNIFQVVSWIRLLYKKQSISLDLTFKYCYRRCTINQR